MSLTRNMFLFAAAFGAFASFGLAPFGPSSQGGAMSIAPMPPPMPADLLADPATVITTAVNVTSARYPDADSVLVDNRIHTRYEPDGTDVTWVDEWVKVLTEKGRRSHAAVSLSFNARYGDAVIQLVEIVGTNGVVRKVDFENTLKIATDNSSTSMNIVDPMDKRMVCSIPGLAVGELRHVVFCRRVRKARMKDAWADAVIFQHTSPIVSTVASVDQPPSRPVAKAVLRNPFKKTVVRSPNKVLPDGYTRLKWTARNVPQVYPEPYMPPLPICAQSLRLSTVPNWETVSRWYWSITAPHLEKTTPEMTNIVHSLVKDCLDEDAKIRALFKFVSQEIRYMGLTLEDGAPGYEPHDVNVTFDNRYGVCRDKAALLVSLLRIAGIPAYPVLIHFGARMDPDVPLPFFNHAITAVERKGKGYMLMDPTDESTRDLMPSYLSNKSYLVARPDGETLRTSPVPPVAGNRLKVESNASLSADGDILYSATLRFGGLNDTRFRGSLLKEKPTERHRRFEGVLRRMAPGAEILALDIDPVDLHDTSKPLVVRLTAKLPSLLMKGTTRDVLTLPLFTRVFNLADAALNGATTLERRRFPLVLNSTCGAEENLTLNLGEVAFGAPCALPKDVVVTNVPGYSFERKVRLNGGRMSVYRRLDLSAVDFPASRYAKLRNARKEVETADRAKPAFTKDANGNANVRTILSQSVGHLRSPKSWVVTNVIEKEILTYSGKKSASELKYFYAPSTRSIDFLYATVSNKNGNVFSVTPREMNVLDCGWAAAAPRYPASKQLVINLPGVEIGSVLRYSWVVDVTNSPVAYNFQNAFESVQPIERLDVEMHVPENMPFKLKELHGENARDGSSGWSHSAERAANGDMVYRWWAVNPKLIPDEPALPNAALWRHTLCVSAADWESYGREFDSSLAAARDRGSDEARRVAHECTVDADTPSAKIAAIRAYLAHNMRISGPGLFELPFSSAFSAPDRALADGYASYADFMNLFFTMLDELGFDCKFILADGVSQGIPELAALRREIPSPEWYNSLFIRAEIQDGGFPGIFGFLAFGGERQIFNVGLENEYTPPETSSHVGEQYFDPDEVSFGKVSLNNFDADKWGTYTEQRHMMTVRENGSVDFDVTNLIYGVGVGGFRKRFAEMLPGVRTRFYQELLGKVAQNATATKELVTDVKSYPAEMTFSVYVENFAVVQGDTMTVILPDFAAPPFGVTGSSRKSPFVISEKKPDTDIYEVVFPKGWTCVESLPESFRFTDPLGRDAEWQLVHEVSERVAEDGLLHVTVRRFTRRPSTLFFSADYFPMFQEWDRRAAAPSARTIVVRRQKES